MGGLFHVYVSLSVDVNRLDDLLLSNLIFNFFFFLTCHTVFIGETQRVYREAGGSV